MELRLSVLLSLCLLLGLTCPNWARKGRCPGRQTCDTCIQVGPECAWCNQPDTPGPRCNTEDKLLKAGCGGHVYNPQGRLLSTTNQSRTREDRPIQATVVQLTLRPGVIQSVILSLPTDQQQTREVSLETSPVPEHLNITFNHTGNPWVQQVNVEAIHCPRENGSWEVTITPKGFDLLLELHITSECVCECMRGREESSPSCGGRGALVCGQCVCPPPYSGARCQRGPPAPGPGSERCRAGPEALPCSGRGACLGGLCVCEAGENPVERYSGQYCECSDGDCPSAGGRLCGGHGRCVCGRCQCDQGWTHEACDCSMAVGPCMGAHQMICSGQGLCQCGQCVCQGPYRGAGCQEYGRPPPPWGNKS